MFNSDSILINSLIPLDIDTNYECDDVDNPELGRKKNLEIIFRVTTARSAAEQQKLVPGGITDLKK